jgi:hypothetical protein
MLEDVKMSIHQYLPTFFFQKYTAFCNHYWYISVDVALAFIIEERDGYICVADRRVQRDAKDTGCCCCVMLVIVREVARVVRCQKKDIQAVVVTAHAIP